MQHDPNVIRTDARGFRKLFVSEVFQEQGDESFFERIQNLCSSVGVEFNHGLFQISRDGRQNYYSLGEFFRPWYQQLAVVEVSRATCHRFSGVFNPEGPGGLPESSRR